MSLSLPKRLLLQDEHAFVTLVGQRLGLIAKTEVRCLLAGEITKFVTLTQGEVDLIRQLADERKVNLPV